MAFGVLAVLLMAVALWMPWYMIDSDGTAAVDTSDSGKFNARLDFYTGKLEAHVESPYIESGSDDRSWQYEDVPGNLAYVAGKPADTFGTTGLIALAAVAVTICFVVVTVTLAFLRRSLQLAAVLGVIAAIVILTAPFYLMVALPGAWPEADNAEPLKTAPSNSFFGSETNATGNGYTQASWGGSIGWFLALGGGVCMFIAALLCFLHRPRQQTRRQPGEEQDFIVTSDG